MKCSDTFKNYYINQIITVKTDDVAVVRATALIYTANNDYIYEVIRRKENWKKYIHDKVERYERIFENLEMTTPEFYRMPKLVICGEDREQNLEIANLLKNVECINLKILYTEDRLNLPENFKDSLYEIKE